MEKEKSALFWKALKNKGVQCQLCPRYCMIKDGGRGNCGVRKNIKGKLFSLVYGKPCSVGIDPIEKKPFYHFLPGQKTFSVATAGCNLHCMYCQNWKISQCMPENVPSLDMPPEKVVLGAKYEDAKIISYTYTEPTVFYEYMLDTARLAVKKKIRNTFVSNGFINQEPLKKLAPLIEAANIDLKGDENFYKKVTGAWIEPVLETLKELKKKGVWIEITNLIIPTLNDSRQQIQWLAKWIYDNLGADVPLHFSAFWPTYKLTKLPQTSIEKLKEARKIAINQGLNYVYTGNLPDDVGNNTYCPQCHALVIRRSEFYVIENKMINGKCPSCRTKIAGVWK